MVAQGDPSQADARGLAAVEVAERNSHLHEAVQRPVEPLCQPRVVVEHVHRNAACGQPGKDAGPRMHIPVKGGHVLHVVRAAERAGVPTEGPAATGK